MVTLLPNTAAQSIYLTLDEKRKYIPTFTYYLVKFTNQLSNESFIVIANVDSDNTRYTKIDISTATDDAINGDIQILQTGQFWYTVYGQNSATNLDPDDATVVGVVEVGILHVLTQENFYDDPTISIPNQVVYYDWEYKLSQVHREELRGNR